MIIDSKGKLFGKISIIDIIIVLIIVIGVAGVFFKYWKSSTSLTSKGDTIVVTFYQEEVAEYVPNSLKMGDMVTDRATGSNFGKVKDVRIEPAVSFAQDDRGIITKSSKPGYSSVYITVEGSGIYKDGVEKQGAAFGSVDYFIYKSVELQAGNTTLWTKVQNLSKKE